MDDEVDILIDGKPVRVKRGTSVAAAIVQSGAGAFRRSVEGEARGPLCGMGVCFECRARVDGIAQRRTCQLRVRDGMEVWTDDAR